MELSQNFNTDFAMSDMEEDEDYGFEYETDDDEEQDVDIENQVSEPNEFFSQRRTKSDWSFLVHTSQVCTTILTLLTVFCGDCY